MDGMSGGLLLVLGGAAVVLALFVANLWLTAKRGEGSRLLSRLTHGLGVVVVGCNIWRYADDSSSTVLAANIVALLCIVASWYRAEKNPLTMPED